MQDTNDSKVKVLDVNELRDILTKHFGKQIFDIQAIEYADINNQYNIKKSTISFGGVLNIFVEFVE